MNVFPFSLLHLRSITALLTGAGCAPNAGAAAAPNAGAATGAMLGELAGPAPNAAPRAGAQTPAAVPKPAGRPKAVGAAGGAVAPKLKAMEGRGPGERGPGGGEGCGERRGKEEVCVGTANNLRSRVRVLLRCVVVPSLVRNSELVGRKLSRGLVRAVLNRRGAGAQVGAWLPVGEVGKQNHCFHF